MRWTTGLLLLPMLAGCPKKSPSDTLVGTWTDESGTRYWIGRQGSDIAVTSAIDGDGEVFPVAESGWRNGHFYWIYNVPSTSYVVTMEVLSVKGDEAQAGWSNDHGAAGTEVMRRD